MSSYKIPHLCFHSWIPGHPQEMTWLEGVSIQAEREDTVGRGQNPKGTDFYTMCIFSPTVIPGLVDIKIQFHQDELLGCSELFIELGMIIAEGAPWFFIKVFAEALSDLLEIKVPVVFS